MIIITNNFWGHSSSLWCIRHYQNYHVSPCYGMETSLFLIENELVAGEDGHHHQHHLDVMMIICATDTMTQHPVSA